MSDYLDAVSQISETTYQEASALEKTGDQEGAYNLFISLGEYSDSFERANKPYYDLGVQKREAKEWDAAVAAFEHAGVYSDAAEQALATRYEEGIAKRSAEDWGGAREAFTKAGEYSDAAEQIIETTYQEAASAYKAEEFEKAYSIYYGIKGYKDADRLLKEDDNLAAVREAKTMPYRKTGNVVTFGTYPQTEKGTDQTPIKWIVLEFDEANNKALLLSKYGLDAVPYNTEWVGITWKQCTLRAWLNGEFLNKAFSTQEQSAILVTNVDNSPGQGYSKWNKYYENNTRDQILLLSYAEANRYLGVTYDDKNNIESRVAPTAYAIAQGSSTHDRSQTVDGEPAAWWWLRSPGSLQGSAADVSSDGSLDYCSVISVYGVVRPAFWLNLESDFF